MSEVIERLDDIFFLVDRARSENLLVDGRTEDDECCISSVDRFLDTVQSEILTLKTKLIAMKR